MRVFYLFIAISFTAFLANSVSAQGVGGGFSPGGGFASPDPSGPVVTGPIVTGLDPIETLVDNIGIPIPVDDVDDWLPLYSTDNPPEFPGNVAYCGASALCGGTPGNGIPRNVPLATLEVPTPSVAQSAVVLSNAGFPSAVAIIGGVGNLCSGVMISNRTVLTAAHCVCDHVPSDVWIGNSVIPDALYQTGFNESKELSGKVIFFDDAFCSHRKGYDLAAVRLRDEAAITNSFYHEYLPTQPLAMNSFKGTTVGFGASNTSSLGGVKRVANIDVELCTTEHFSSGEACTPTLEWISFSKNGTDTCKGDSGGPLYMHASDGTLRLVGLTSRKRGGGGAPYCGDGGIYTNITVQEVVSWLNDVK